MHTLHEIAVAANNGASNPYALIRSLAEALPEIKPHEIRSNLDVKIIVGQISFLLGESLGPTVATYTEWNEKHDEAELNKARETQRKIWQKRKEENKQPYEIRTADMKEAIEKHLNDDAT